MAHRGGWVNDFFLSVRTRGGIKITNVYFNHNSNPISYPDSNHKSNPISNLFGQKGRECTAFFFTKSELYTTPSSLALLLRI